MFFSKRENADLAPFSTDVFNCYTV